MIKCFFIDGLLSVLLPDRPGTSLSHTEPDQPLVVPSHGGTRQLALPTAREEPGPDPASTPDWVLI